MRKLRVLDLFSGIGGFSLGLERTGGFETVAFCEIEPFPRRVLAKHWPEVPCYEDVRKLTADRDLLPMELPDDVICGGFPCQDISLLENVRGAWESELGLWSEITRLVGELRPSFVIVENVSALLGRGRRMVGRVLGDLAALGYDAEWHCIPAAFVGRYLIARDRVWIVAYPTVDELQQGLGASGRERSWHGNRGSDCWVGFPAARRFCEVMMGFPPVDRIGQPGNAVVPQIPELIGHAILASRRAAA
jgi:DNA (cytosine-5)-methyltransferase 1